MYSTVQTLSERLVGAKMALQKRCQFFPLPMKKESLSLDKDPSTAIEQSFHDGDFFPFISLI